MACTRAAKSGVSDRTISRRRRVTPDVLPLNWRFEMQFVPTRLVLAGVMAITWISWAVWANVPHYYNAQEMEQKIAAVVGPNNVNLKPANAGFPFAFMRYDYSNNDHLTVYDTELSALLPNVLFSIICAVGVALLIVRTRCISLGGLALLGCLLLPAVLLYLRLNGLHPHVITYLYLAPLVMLLLVVASEMARKQKGKNQAMHPSREVEHLGDGESLVATG